MTLDTTGGSAAQLTSNRWSQITRVPRGPVGAAQGRVAEALLRRAVRQLPVRLQYPDGSIVGAADPTLPTLTMHRPDALFRRVGSYGLIGFGESYMAGDWTSGDLPALLTEFASSVDVLIPRALQPLRPLAVVRHPRSMHNNPAQSRRNIAEHYDLSNALFAEFLDETLTYSSALFQTSRPSWSDLADGQRAKIDRLLDVAQVTAGTRMLEIGTGWGELAIRAARRGASVHTITLSTEQLDLARRRAAAAGVADRVHVELRDYRDVDGRYDAVVSVEMIEAVGYRFWPVFFGTLDKLVRPGGRVALQAITMPHDRMLASRNTYTWIQKYIFPGGLLPSVEAVVGITERSTSLRTVDMFSLQHGYAETLRLWRERFVQRAPALSALGFDDTFQRMWELYLAYAEAGFRSGYLDVYQWTFAPTGGHP
ncbi:class I SAM-dependent methyltransferase [Mycolicibacterium diernhoferi]|uniref:SAM-dependent methyltransferase n=1 Tax=Mycolicibacterium diernhoferi TaxID=1801 RepID=A0A1Q4H522_9MYCO|nr:class I SAM-dependent methyltransferase [Mycolicibacterium diernhoferi]OJZ62491.1 SAM-dependent methyltransferase [Mycolicibacterium diernhoferi]OPE49332.1 SAM-dependent methyltransferase [Mycolicibacterium diernhoferi]PEG52198.1 SAM-dependent methyltransferase [Mycolicibacterium diernhoferi]QYL21996.1 class I SAM-dependent methyltransferase [Mycolicibacterium diernhoferi]